jgi:hypothetical protein
MLIRAASAEDGLESSRLDTEASSLLQYANVRASPLKPSRVSTTAGCDWCLAEIRHDVLPEYTTRSRLPPPRSLCTRTADCSSIMGFCLDVSTLSCVQIALCWALCQRRRLPGNDAHTNHLGALKTRNHYLGQRKALIDQIWLLAICMYKLVCKFQL